MDKVGVNSSLFSCYTTRKDFRYKIIGRKYGFIDFITIAIKIIIF